METVQNSNNETYSKKYVRLFAFKLNKERDGELIDFLERSEKKTNVIRDALAEYVKREMRKKKKNETQ